MTFFSNSRPSFLALGDCCRLALRTSLGFLSRGRRLRGSPLCPPLGDFFSFWPLMEWKPLQHRRHAPEATRPGDEMMLPRVVQGIVWRSSVTASLSRSFYGKAKWRSLCHTHCLLVQVSDEELEMDQRPLLGVDTFTDSGNLPHSPTVTSSRWPPQLPCPASGPPRTASMPSSAFIIKKSYFDLNAYAPRSEKSPLRLPLRPIHLVQTHRHKDSNKASLPTST